MKAGYYQFCPEFGEKEQNLEKIKKSLKKVRDSLIVLPELCTSGYLFLEKEEVAKIAEDVPSGKTTKFFCDISKTNNNYIVAGIAEKDGDKFYNSAIITGPNGFIGSFRKAHLFNEEKKFFNSGDTPFSVWDINGIKIGVMICFDWFFPESARILSLKGADIICHPANLVLPYCPEAMITRSVENRVFAITCNRTGFEERWKKQLYFIGTSQIVDPKGNILARASEENEELKILEINPELSRNKIIKEYNDLFKDRRIDLYETLTKQ